MIIIFDCETNGKIKDYKLPCEVVDNFPRLSQLSYEIYDESQNLVKRVNQFVKPDGWVFPDEQFFRDHADINKNNELGKPVKEVLLQFIEDRKTCHYIVAHNMSFDSRVIRAEMIRAGLESLTFNQAKICTMLKSTAFCNLQKANGHKGAKFPQLVELHKKLFNEGFDGAHDSGGDVAATARCLFELLRLKVISLE